MKKIISIILTLVMLVGVIGTATVTALADGENVATVSGNKYAYNKAATPLYDGGFTDVTLTVGGTQDNLGVDIIYIIGGFLSRSDIESNVMINCLMDTFAEIIATGTPVNFGMVPFSSDATIVLELTTLSTLEDLEALPDVMAAAIEKAGKVYDQVNMENALLKAKKMFSESKLADHPERQHLVMISSGHTYYFNSGEENDVVSVVPVNLRGGGAALGGLFCSEKAWMQARNKNPNTYPIPKAIVDEYEANKDKYDNLWDCYWSYIDMWAKADIAAGDTIVYDATTVAASDFLTWTGTWRNFSTTWRSYGSVDPNATAEDIAAIPVITPGENPLTSAGAAHAILNERAMWEAYNTAQSEIIDAGINFYPIYSKLRANGSTTNGTWCDNRANEDGSKFNYGVTWTNQYIGHSFMNFLAGGEAVVYSSTDNKAFFDPIKNSIIYSLSAGSKVVDYIGYDAEEGYNFNFIEDASKLTLMFGETAYTCTKLETANEGATSSYVFTAPESEEAAFTVDYFAGDLGAEEHFVWTFNVNIPRLVNVSLTYQLFLEERNETVGTHDADTNQSATLYPISSEDEALEPEIFNKPTIEYENVPVSAELVIDGEKYLNDELAGDFEFCLTAEDGTTFIAISDENGAFAFDTLVYDSEGEFVYTVTELAGDDEDVVYDETEYTVTVKVELVDNAYTVTAFAVTVDGAEAEVVFNNYTTDFIEENDTPLTGDNGTVLAFVGVMVSLAALAYIAMSKKKISVK